MTKYELTCLKVEEDGRTVDLKEGDIPISYYGIIVTVLRPRGGKQ
jgi:hypothetical protein